ncbi:MAG: hypothetical protein ACR2H1_03850 [Limisphaerales bacterium]
MPTIELISIGCSRIPDLPRYDSFAYIAEKNLVSHRDLFQSVFDSLTGVIVHLADKKFESEPEGCWFADMIMEWKEDNALRFLPDTLPDVRDLMQHLLKASPENRITFSSDYQFGDKRREHGEIHFAKFFDLHTHDRLRYNHLYFIRANPDFSP